MLSFHMDRWVLRVDMKLIDAWMRTSCCIEYLCWYIEEELCRKGLTNKVEYVLMKVVVISYKFSNDLVGRL